MDAERLRAEVLAALDAGQAARGAGSDEARVACLNRAAAGALQLADAPLLQKACWRLAKAHRDQGRITEVLPALSPALALTHERGPGWVSVRTPVGPFDHYAQGLRAWPELARAHGDAAGYLHPSLEPMWEAWVARQEALEEPILAWWGRVELAWVHAATGRLARVEGLAATLERLRPSAVERASQLHARAQDPASSLLWLQLDLSRTWLWAATWQADAASAWRARELMLDVAAELDTHLHEDVWALDALVGASRRFPDHDLPEGAAHALHGLLERMPEGHRARVRATLHTSGPAAREAATLLRASGPEWVLWCIRLAESHGADTSEDVVWAERAGARVVPLAVLSPPP